MQPTRVMGSRLSLLFIVDRVAESMRDSKPETRSRRSWHLGKQASVTCHRLVELKDFLRGPNLGGDARNHRGPQILFQHLDNRQIVPARAKHVDTVGGTMLQENLLAKP